jgi:hypothetical protein
MSLIQRIIDGEITLKQAKEIEESMPTQLPPPSDYKIVRTYSAGVFAGYIESRNGQEVVMIKVRRLWQWAGAASLSQLAQSGTSSPEKCKFPEEVNRIELLQAIEILDVTNEAKNSIEKVNVWNA